MQHTENQAVEVKKTYELKCIQPKKPGGKFTYEVIDQDGNIISTRQSHRIYMACTIDGDFFFGRVDLIGKGTHGETVKNRIKNGKPLVAIAYAKN